MKRLAYLLSAAATALALTACDGMWVSSDLGGYNDGDPYYSSVYNDPCWWFPTTTVPVYTPVYTPAPRPPRGPGWNGGDWHPGGFGGNNGPQHWMPAMGTGVNVGAISSQRPSAGARPRIGMSFAPDWRQ